MSKRHKRRAQAVAMPVALNDGRGGRPDYGDDLGPAMQARPSQIERVSGEYRSVGQTAVDARRYQDAALYDRMHAVGQLSDRQHTTAVRLAKLWTAAGLDQRVGSRYSDLPTGRALDAADDEETPRDVYRRLMRGRQAADLLEGMLCGRHPGWQLERLQGALDALAREWGIDDRGAE